MHQIILLTALTATSGLFGGGRQCGAGGCGRPTMGYTAYAPQQYAACQPGTACGAVAQPTYYAAPQPTYAAPQAPMQYAPAPQAAAYPSYYYPTAGGCAGGNCARR